MGFRSSNHERLIFSFAFIESFWWNVLVIRIIWALNLRDVIHFISLPLLDQMMQIEIYYWSFLRSLRLKACKCQVIMYISIRSMLILSFILFHYRIWFLYSNLLTSKLVAICMGHFQLWLFQPIHNFYFLSLNCE